MNSWALLHWLIGEHDLTMRMHAQATYCDADLSILSNSRVLTVPDSNQQQEHLALLTGPRWSCPMQKVPCPVVPGLMHVECSGECMENDLP